MVDYTHATGQHGTMMIRDSGFYVEFWINANESSTYAYQMPWGYTVNGVTSGTLSWRYSQGAGWDMLGRWAISTDQTVTFRLGDTGTNALGGPTSFSHFIARATVPSPPSQPKLSAILANNITVAFTDGANGGAAIDSRQIGYGIDPNYVQYTTSSDGSTNIGALASGKVWYFWARTHNAKGYSGWSTKASAATLRVPDPPTAPLLSSVKSTSVDISFSGNGNGGSAITLYEIGYGTNELTPTTTIPATSPQVLTGLKPGTLYYFRTRAKNSVGFSAWSAATSIRTVAGAYVKIPGPVTEDPHTGLPVEAVIWVLAVPYVNVGGVWKVAEPWTRNVGEWKRNI